MHDTLTLGLRHHQQGRLDEADRLYQAVLAQQPGDPDALHLLGVVALQTGGPPPGRRADRPGHCRNPGSAAYHANLAEAYRRSGQLDRAADCCRTALRLQPHYAGGGQQPRPGPAGPGQERRGRRASSARRCG